MPGFFIALKAPLFLINGVAASKKKSAAWALRLRRSKNEEGVTL